MRVKPHIMLARRGFFKCPVYVCGLRVGPFRRCGKGVTPEEAYTDWQLLMRHRQKELGSQQNTWRPSPWHK